MFLGCTKSELEEEVEGETRNDRFSNLKKPHKQEARGLHCLCLCYHPATQTMSKLISSLFGICQFAAQSCFRTFISSTHKKNIKIILGHTEVCFFFKSAAGPGAWGSENGHLKNIHNPSVAVLGNTLIGSF